ncbi:MAG: septum formation initiator family protein [Candidatus Omnitrophica bacterium]|nr:septum formation initiator family protein [Candidatus Omnitrophota bacterium]
MKNAFILFAVAFFILLLFLPTFSQKQLLQEKNRQYLKEIYELKRQNAELTEERRKLEDDPVYLEKVAREKMGLVRDGEVIYRISPVPVNSSK